MKKRYTAAIGGSSWAKGPEATFATIRECRAFAEGYGETADYCIISDGKGRKVGEHRRDKSENKWFRACI